MKRLILALILLISPLVSWGASADPGTGSFGKILLKTRGSAAITTITKANYDNLLTSAGYANSTWDYFTAGILNKANGGWGANVASATGLASFAAGTVSWITNYSTRWNSTYTTATALAALTGLIKGVAGTYSAITDNSVAWDNDHSSMTAGKPSWDSAYSHSTATTNVHGLTFTAEGTGGGLDADTVDGSQASAFSTTAHNHTPDSLTSVTITSKASNDLLQWNGTAWVNKTIAGAGIEPAIAAGTTAQYRRGDETWQTLNQAAVDGLTTSSSPQFSDLILASNGNIRSTANTKLYIASTGEDAFVTFDIANYRVGIGNDITPTAMLTVGDTGNTQFQVNASGVVTSGTWLGTAIGATKGGTGLTTVGSSLQYARTNTGATGWEWATLNQAAVAGLTTAASPSFAGVTASSGNVAITAGQLTIGGTTAIQNGRQGNLTTSTITGALTITTGSLNLTPRTAPSGAEGQIYANDAGNVPYYHNGTAYKEIAIGGSSPSFAGITATGLTVNGKATTYNSVATEGYGVPAIVDHVGLINQSTSLGPTTCTATSTAGRYRVSYYLVGTTVDATYAPTVQLSITWTDDAGVGRTVSPATAVSIDGLEYRQGIIICSVPSGGVAWTTTVTGNVDDGEYAIGITVERLS